MARPDSSALHGPFIGRIATKTPRRTHRRLPYLVCTRGGILAVVILILSSSAAVSFSETALASNPAAAVRNLPLPKRWSARYIKDPIFNTRVYVVEAGRPNAPAVLLVHGLGQSGYQDWWEVMHGLETKYRLVAIDLPGFARSGMPAGQLSPERYAHLLNWLIHRLDLTDINLVGHSLGAAVALYLSGEYPSRIANVVLIDTAGILQRVAFLREVAKEHFEDYQVPTIFSGYKTQVFNWGERLVESFMIQSQIDATGILRRSGRKWNAMLSDRTNINAAVSLLETDFSQVITHFNRPATIIWGSQDNVVPIRTGHLLHARLPRSRFHVIDGAGHAPMRTHVSEFMARLREALTHPPEPRSEARAQTSSRDNFVCSNERGKTISGAFDRIVIDRCPDMRLVNVTARVVTIQESQRVYLRHVDIHSDTVALNINRSSVTATDVQASGEPAIRIDKSRLDLAGGVLSAPRTGLQVARRSTVVLSVTRVDSGIRQGTLHGAVIAKDRILDNAPKLRSR